jgi:hypothetical protein
MGEVLVSSDCADDGCTVAVGELHGQGSDSAEHAVDQHGGASERSVGEKRSVGRDPRDAQARADLVGHIVG